jgi:hypothetical protein
VQHRYNDRKAGEVHKVAVHVAVILGQSKAVATMYYIDTKDEALANAV